MKNAFVRVAGIVLGTILVVAAWYYAAPLIVQVLDLNLGLIKWGCSLLPAPYGAMAESALRVGLAADKALLLAEGTWFVGFLLRVVLPSRRTLNKH